MNQVPQLLYCDTIRGIKRQIPGVVFNVLDALNLRCDHWLWDREEEDGKYKASITNLMLQPRLIPGDVESLVVTQSNALATSIQAMTLLERRIITLALAVLQRSDTELPYVRIYSSDVRRTYGLVHNSVNQELNDASARLMSRYAEFIRSRHGSNSRIAWVNEVHYTSGQDSEVGMAYVDVQLHPKLSQYVLQLRGSFFKVPFWVLAKLNSIYSIRLCEILMAESQSGKLSQIHFDLSDLLKILDCDSKSYRANFSNFRRRVLESAQAELDEVGFLTFVFETTRRGRKVVGIKFLVEIDQRATRDDIGTNFDDEDVRRVTLENTMREGGFTENPRIYLDKLGVDLVERIYRQCRQAQVETRGTKHEIRNFGGFLHAKLKSAMENPPALKPTVDTDGYIHLKSTEIQKLADDLVQEFSQERTAYAMQTFESLPTDQRELIKERVYGLDAWTLANIQKEGEQGVSFRGAIRRVLEAEGLIFPSHLESVHSLTSELHFEKYRPEDRKQIFSIAQDML